MRTSADWPCLMKSQQAIRESPICRQVVHHRQWKRTEGFERSLRSVAQAAFFTDMPGCFQIARPRGHEIFDLGFHVGGVRDALFNLLTDGLAKPGQTGIADGL